MSDSFRFKYYNPQALIPIFKERGYNPYSYRPCSGCIFTEVAPEFCIFQNGDFKAPEVQSDMFCPHCVDTINESGEKFLLYMDETLQQKRSELEHMLEKAAE